MKIVLVGLSLFCAVVSSPAQAPSSPVTCKAEAIAKTEADAAFAREDYAAAEKIYSSQADVKPDTAVWAGLVHSQLELGKLPEALASAKRAVAALPKLGDALALVGDAELRAGHLDEAQDAYARARALDPCSAAAHFGNARLLQLSSQYASALKEFAFAHRLAPANGQISEALFALLPPSMEAKGLRNLLASDHELSPARRSRLEQRAALLEAGATCTAAAPAGVVKLDLTPVFFDGVSVRDYALRVQATGGSAVILELDSTSSGITLSQADADKLKVTPILSGNVTPPYVGYIQSLVIGKQHYEKCPVTVVPDATLARRYSLIGTDFFRDSLIHLDWVAKQITLTPYAEAAPANGAPVDATTPPNEKNWAKVFIDQHRILFPGVVEKKPIGLFLFDTSDVLNMLSPAAAAPLHPIEDQTIGVYGVSGELVRVFSKEGGGDVNRSELRDIRGKNLPIKKVGIRLSVRYATDAASVLSLWSYDIAPLSHAADLEVGGILGFSILRQYYIDLDYRNGLISLRPDVNYFYRGTNTESH